MDNKTPLPTGKLLSYKLAVECLDVCKERLAIRPGDKDLIGKAMDYKEEESFIVGSANVDPIFAEQVAPLPIGKAHSFSVEYPGYDPENLLSLPVDYLVSQGYKTEDLQIGLILNVDVLQGKVKIDGEETDLEIIDIRKTGDREFVILDSNEFLKGLKVRYDVKVLEIRDPTLEEIQAESIGVSL